MSREELFGFVKKVYPKSLRIDYTDARNLFYGDIENNLRAWAKEVGVLAIHDKKRGSWVLLLKGDK